MSNLYELTKFIEENRNLREASEALIEKNDALIEKNDALLETIKALKSLIADQKEKIRILESRAKYKEEHIQELRADIDFWKNGYRVMAALTEKYKNLLEEHNAQNGALMAEGKAEHGQH